MHISANISLPYYMSALDRLRSLFSGGQSQASPSINVLLTYNNSGTHVSNHSRSSATGNQDSHSIRDNSNH